MQTSMQNRDREIEGEREGDGMKNAIALNYAN